MGRNYNKFWKLTCFLQHKKARSNKRNNRVAKSENLNLHFSIPLLAIVVFILNKCYLYHKYTFKKNCGFYYFFILLRIFWVSDLDNMDFGNVSHVQEIYAQHIHTKFCLFFVSFVPKKNQIQIQIIYSSFDSYVLHEIM